MRPITLLWLCLLLSICCRGQKQGNIWMLSDNYALDFNSNPPRVFRPFPTGSSFPYVFSSSSLCDSAGRLLCWTNYDNAFGPYGVMSRGIGLGHGSVHALTTLLVPKPGSDSLVYAFHASGDASPTAPYTRYSYSIINTCLDWLRLDSIRGNVIAGQRAVDLRTSGTMGLCAASDGSSGYWILGHRNNSDSFIAWHLTAAGLTERIATRIGPRTTDLQLRMIKFNPAGTKVALVTHLEYPANSTLDLFDFNPATGKLSNHCANDIAPSALPLGLEFSPDGSKVYTSYLGSGNNCFLVQNKVDNNCSVVGLSRDTVFYAFADPNKAVSFGGIQAGPDGNLYIFASSRPTPKTFLHRITDPNNRAHVDTAAISLDSAKSSLFAPSFVAGFRYGNRVPKCSPQLDVPRTIPAKANLRLTPNPADNEVRIIADGLHRDECIFLLSDAAGKTLFNSKSLPERIDLRAFPAGIYFWRVYGHSGFSASGKLLVSH